jgi:hypothetical protein
VKYLILVNLILDADPRKANECESKRIRNLKLAAQCRRLFFVFLATPSVWNKITFHDFNYNSRRMIVKNFNKFNLDGRLQESEGVLAQGNVLQIHVTLVGKIRNNLI